MFATCRLGVLSVALMALVALPVWAQEPGCGGCRGGGEDQEQEKHADSGACIAIPVKNAQAGCCRQAVQEELAKIENVLEVRWKDQGDVPTAVLCVQKGGTISLSQLQEALEGANETMGKAMGLVYELDAETLRLDRAVLVFGEGAAERIETLLGSVEAVATVETRPAKEGALWTVAMPHAGEFLTLAELEGALAGADEQLALEDILFAARCLSCDESEEGACSSMASCLFCVAGAGDCEQCEKEQGCEKERKKGGCGGCEEE